MVNAETQRIREEFVALWGRMASFWGVSPATGRVYGWLITRGEAADAEEILAGLAMSRGAVSMACRELADWGLVLPERVAGSRRVRWSPETDLEKAIRNIVQTRKRREWDPILDRLREWIPALRGDRSAEAAVFRERLASIESLVGLADGMAEQFLKGGVLQRLGLKVLVARARKAQRPGNRTT